MFELVWIQLHAIECNKKQTKKKKKKSKTQTKKTRHDIKVHAEPNQKSLENLRRDKIARNKIGRKKNVSRKTFFFSSFFWLAKSLVFILDSLHQKPNIPRQT